MAGRYLLVTGQRVGEDELKRRLAGLGLYAVVASARLQLFVSVDQPWRYRSPSSAGFVGTLHSRAKSGFATPSAGFPDRDRDDTWLLSSCWGEYLSFRVEASTVKCMRDPSGALPCFFAVQNSSLLLASDTKVLAEALGYVPAIDWDQLARLLFVNDLPEERTALGGVRELLPGHRLAFDGSNAVAMPVWSPWDHVTQDHGPTPKALAQCVRYCATTIAAPYKSILVGVSGGLDSSILTTCLAQRTSDIHPITISTDDAHGDEAQFAKMLCDHLALPLIHETYRLDAVQITRSSVAHLPRPGGRAQLQAYDAAVQRAAGMAGATAFMSGVGGDNVFYYTNSARPLIDRYLQHGWSFHLIATLRDICRLTGCSVGEALRQALAVPRNRNEPAKYRWQADPRFLNAGRLAELSRAPLHHPWLEGPATCLPGRAAHIAMILRAQRYLDGQDRTGPVRYLQPLMAQPIMEMCLGIPSWRAIEGGRDRSVARQAFTNALPAAILDRRVKGGPDGFAHQIIRRNLPEIRERLLGGVLAAHHVIDIDSLAVALREAHLMSGIDYVRILLLLDTEAWARHWIDQRPEEVST